MRSRLTRFPVWSSFALLPTAVLLGSVGNVLALVYAASMIVTLAYHWSHERRYRKLDHVLAWAVIVANCLLTLETRSWLWTAVGLGCVLAGLWFYRGARRARYDSRHGWWHVLSGLACWCFAKGLLAC